MLKPARDDKNFKTEIDRFKKDPMSFGTERVDERPKGYTNQSNLKDPKSMVERQVQEQADAEQAAKEQRERELKDVIDSAEAALATNVDAFKKLNKNASKELRELNSKLIGELDAAMEAGGLEDIKAATELLNKHTASLSMAGNE